MERKKLLWTSVCIVCLLLPMSYTKAYEFRDKITDTTSLFFLVALDKDQDDNLLISLTHEGDGEFYIFLFNFRPNKTNVNIDKTFNNEIFAAALLYNESALNYTHTEDTALIYYIQIVLLNGGPDFFTLNSNLTLVRYYLPSLPGFPVEIMLISSIISIGLIIIIIKKKRI